MGNKEKPTAQESTGAVVRRELAGYLAWAAYMTHNLLDGIDLQLSDEEKKRLSKQAQEYEKVGAKYSRAPNRPGSAVAGQTRKTL